MADLAAEDLVDNAKARFGEDILQNRIRGAKGDASLADLELVKIAKGVISTFEAALSVAGVWPLPGFWPTGSTDAEDRNISGRAYREIWPFALQEHALNIFNLRTFAGWGEVDEHIKDIGTVGEAFLVDIQSGAAVIEIGTVITVPPIYPIAARNRDGSSNIAGIADMSNSFGGLINDWDFS